MSKPASSTVAQQANAGSKFTGFPSTEHQKVIPSHMQLLVKYKLGLVFFFVFFEKMFYLFFGLLSNGDGSDVPTTARTGADQIFIGNDVEGGGKLMGMLSRQPIRGELEGPGGASMHSHVVFRQHAWTCLTLLCHDDVSEKSR